jgi:hypothetical protein
MKQAEKLVKIRLIFVLHTRMHGIRYRARKAGGLFPL